MIQCYIYPHTWFDTIMEKNEWTDENRPENTAFISICCLPEIKKGYLEAVKKDEKVAKLLENNEVIKEIYVPGKILNLVVKK